MGEIKIIPSEADSDFHLLMDAWTGWCRNGHLPARRDFDPILFPKLLPNITLFDVITGGARQRYKVRLVGTDIVRALRQDTTGAILNSLPKTRSIVRRCDVLCETGEPYFVADQPVTWVNENYRSYATLGLPLAEDGRSVNMIMFLMKFS